MSLADIHRLKEWLLAAEAVLAPLQPPAKSSRYATMERFVLDQGKPYRSRPVTSHERVVITAAMQAFRTAYGNFEHRQCFANSQRLVVSDDTGALVYVEGYAWTSGLRPVLHGWVEINGAVIDVTLPATSEADPEIPEPRRVLGGFKERAYLGVPFCREYVRERSMATLS